MVKFYSRELRGPLNAYRCIVPIITSYEIISNATPRRGSVVLSSMTMNDHRRDERSNFNGSILLLDPLPRFEFRMGKVVALIWTEPSRVPRKTPKRVIEEYKRREGKKEERRSVATLPMNYALAIL